jgi:hypothetical protein
MGGWVDGWMGGWMGGRESRVKDCLQQSKTIPAIWLILNNSMALQFVAECDVCLFCLFIQANL